MQVNRVSPMNFGKMNIAKTPQTIKALEQLPQSVKWGVDRAAKRIENTKFFDISVKYNEKIGELECLLESPKDAFFGVFNTFKQRIKQGRNKDIILFGDTLTVEKQEKLSPEGKIQYRAYLWPRLPLNNIAGITNLSNVALILDEGAIKNSEGKVD